LFISGSGENFPDPDPDPTQKVRIRNPAYMYTKKFKIDLKKIRHIFSSSSGCREVTPYSSSSFYYKEFTPCSDNSFFSRSGFIFQIFTK